jgi:hypothetical protein
MIKKLKMKWFLGSVLMILGLSTSVWGYGLDGYANSTEFKNLLGPYSQGYPNWAWEGGGDPNAGGWTRDNLGNDAMSHYDNFPAQDTSYSSDGDILTHIAMEDPQVASYSSGFYRAFNNHYYAPKGGSNNYGILEQEVNDGDGFTVEWRFKLRDSNNDTAWGLTNGYYFGFNVDECPNLYVRIGGYDGTDSVAKFPGGLSVPIADVTQWHKYRFTVLGNDGSGTIRANFYQDTTLVIEEMAVGVVDQVDTNGRVLWCGAEWGSDIAGGQHTKQIDYVRVDTFGAYAPPPENCGDQGTVYMAADTNKDCVVDYHDFAEIADGLGRCTDPANLDCESRPWIYEDFLSSVWNPTNATSAPMVDGNTNGWDITHEGTLWPGGIVYREDWDPTSAACLRGNANEAGVSQITRDIGERTAGSVSFGYTTGYSPDFGGRVILRTFNTDVMTLRLGTEWNGSAYRGFIETDPAGTAAPNDPIEILTSAGGLSSNMGNIVKVSFDFDTDGIFNIDVRSDTQDWNHALTTTILFQNQFGVTTVPYIDQIRFASKASKDPHTPADTTIYHSYFCFGRGDGEGIGIDVPKSVCGDFGTSYFDGDITGLLGFPDCYVDMLDVAQLFSEWLTNAVSRPPLQPGFQDVTLSVGLNLPMEGVTGVAWIDFDNDGWVDLYCRRNADSVLYRNNGASDPDNVTFSYFTQLGNGWGTWGDFDNDGFADLLTWSLGIRLYKNNNGLTFTDVSSKLPAGLDTLTPVSRSARWGDFNGDGYIDLYMGGYESAGFAGYPDFILTNIEDLANLGQRKFQLTWQESPAYRNSRGVTACDFDVDNDLDIYVSNYRLQGNFLWRNNGTGIFTDVAGTYNALGGNGHTIGSAWGDIDNDGNFDLFVGNFAHPGQPQSRFLRNLGSPDYHFNDLGTCGVQWQESYASPTLGDFDNDGDLDLFFTTVYPANNARLYRNDGSCNFTDVTSQQNLSGLNVTYEAAWADYDNNGYLDLFSSGKLFKNGHSSINHWLKVKLNGNNNFGVNLSAIGTQVRIDTGTQIISRQVEAGTGEGNQNDLTLHFGLGKLSTLLSLEIRWPDGTIQNYGPTAVDQIIEVTR